MTKYGTFLCRAGWTVVREKQRNFQTHGESILSRGAQGTHLELIRKLSKYIEL